MPTIAWIAVGFGFVVAVVVLTCIIAAARYDKAEAEAGWRKTLEDSVGERRIP